MFIIKKNDFTTAATFKTKADARNYLFEHHFDLADFELIEIEIDRNIDDYKQMIIEQCYNYFVATILMEFGLSPPKCIQQGYKRNIPSINDFVKGRFKEKEYMITRVIPKGS